MQSIVQVPARSTPHSSLERACALHRGLFTMTDGLRQRGMPSSLHTHHHYEKRPPSGAPHEKITVWNTQVPRKLALSHAFGPCGRETAQTCAGLGPHMESVITAVRRARYHRVPTYLSPAAPSRRPPPPSCHAYRQTALLYVSLCHA